MKMRFTKSNLQLWERGHKRPARFTLIELFVVMIIIVIMFSILSPMYERIGAANRVGSTARVIGSHLSLARQLAQSKRRYVALVLPGNVSELEVKDKFATFRLAYLDENGGVFDSWVEDSKWKYLPKGCSIMEADKDIGIQKVTSSVLYYEKNPFDDNMQEINGVNFNGVLVESGARLCR